MEKSITEDLLKPLELPDKSKVEISLDRLRVPEAMFEPTNYNKKMHVAPRDIK